MFALVDDVERYPEFLPWCEGAEVLERTQALTTARLHINYLGVRKSFTTTNRKEANVSMEIELVEGPFRDLAGHWRFRPLRADASKVELELAYTFSNKLLESLIGPVFGQIANTLVERFVERADRPRTR